MCNLTIPPFLANTRAVGVSIDWFDETDSTNTLALGAERDGAVFVAERQTAGRGRHGRRWHSAPGLGLWFSVALRAPLPGLSFAAALAIRDAVAPRVALEIRWPNDLYAGARKVCGMLVEQRGDWLALGVGLNVNHESADFPPSLRHRAGSLALAEGVPWERGALLIQLLRGLDSAVDRLRRGEARAVRADWAAACDIVGRKVRRGALCGNVAAIDEDGSLLIDTHAGMRRISCGDVSVVR